MDLLPVALDLTDCGVVVKDKFCLAGADAQSLEGFSQSYCRDSYLPNAFYELVTQALRGQASDLQETPEICSQATRASPGERLELLRSVTGRSFKLLLS